jgi:putative transposase
MEEIDKIKLKFEKSLKNLKYYKHSSHATYNLTCHCVWITKYRRKVITDDIKKRLETIIKWVCKEHYIIVVALGFEEDHVHCLLSLPIKIDIPKIFKLIKWRCSSVIWKEYELHLSKYYYKKKNRALWAVWYFLCSVWKVDKDIVKKYVENQWREDERGTEVKM